MVESLVAWIREQVTAAGSRGVVFGMSGGIDSAVVGVLCQKALPQTALGVCMPCYSDERDIEDARQVAATFEIPLKVIPLEAAFDSLRAVLPSGGCDAKADRLLAGNLKARLRMSVLYYFGNWLNHLVVGSSNRSELAAGYFTKYGDGAADILPLGNLVKSEVRALGRKLGIPQEIVDKTPSAGLWAGQTDEDELGFTYEQLDRYLKTVEAEEDVLKRIEALCLRNAHKKRMPLIAPL